MINFCIHKSFSPKYIGQNSTDCFYFYFIKASLSTKKGPGKAFLFRAFPGPLSIFMKRSISYLLYLIFSYLAKTVPRPQTAFAASIHCILIIEGRSDDSGYCPCPFPSYRKSWRMLWAGEHALCQSLVLVLFHGKRPYPRRPDLLPENICRCPQCPHPG